MMLGEPFGNELVVQASCNHRVGRVSHSVVSLQVGINMEKLDGIPTLRNLLDF